MEILRDKKTNVAKVYDANGKHQKTIPGYHAKVLKDEDIILLFQDGLSLEGKKLNAADIKLISEKHLVKYVNAYFDEMKKKDKYAYELISKVPFTGVRSVNGYRGKKRYEMVFKDNTKTIIKKPLYDMFADKLKHVNLNY